MPSASRKPILAVPQVQGRKGERAENLALVCRIDKPFLRSPFYGGRQMMVLISPRWACYDPTITAAIAFDTDHFVKRLTECGFTKKEAETLAEEHVAPLNANLATKEDIAAVKTDIDSGNHGQH